MGIKPLRELAEHTLGGNVLFCGVDADTVLGLGERADWRSVSSGYPILRLGDVSSNFTFLVSGTAHIHNISGLPNETVHACDIIGLRLALRREPADIHVVTTTPALLAVMTRGDLFAAMTDSPALASNFSMFLAGRGDRDQARERLDARVALALISDASGDASAPTAVPINVTLWATLLGVDAIDVRRSLQRLMREGLIRSEGAHHVRVDAEGLRRRFT